MIFLKKSHWGTSPPSTNDATTARIWYGHYVSSRERQDSCRWIIMAPKQENKGSHRLGHDGQLCASLNRKIDRDTTGYKHWLNIT